MSRGTSFVAGLRDGLRAEWLAETGYESPIRNVSAAQMPLQPIARAAHDRHDSRVPLIAPPAAPSLLPRAGEDVGEADR